MNCRRSTQCDAGKVCDRKEHMCRDSRRQVTPMEELAQRCIDKGIPVTYERGPKRGEPKTRVALRRCARQKDRVLFKTATAVTPKATEPAKPVSPFVRPPEAELRKMTKADLTKIYMKGQDRGYIDPAKPADAYTNQQLINAIRRATQPRFA